MNNRAAIILAAGEGSRMRSALPKALQVVGGRTLLDWSLSLAEDLSCDPVLLVGSPGVPELEELAGDRAIFCKQEESLGTADAVKSASGALRDFTGSVIVLYVDTPLVHAETCERAFAVLEGGAALSILGFEPVEAGDYGRLLTDGSEVVLRIVEAREATESERRIGLCNSGVMAGSWPLMREWLGKVGCDNSKGEYYLTDLVGIARSAGRETRYVKAGSLEVTGVNTCKELALAEEIFQDRARHRALEVGVRMQAPETVFLSWDTELAADVFVEPYVVFGSGVSVASGTVVHGFSHLEGVRIGSGCRIGPFARLRPGTEIGRGSRVGNFVEVKGSCMGEGSKAGHLAYIGDGEVGARVNIGAGTIFCNYDGRDKHRVEVGDGAFIGSNTSLVAPLRIGEGAYAASGSVITEDVAAEALVLGRSRQSVKPGWVSKFRKSKERNSGS